MSDSRGVIDSIEKSDGRKIIHWLPLDCARNARLITPHGKEIIEIEGLLEDVDLVIGNVYQLERVGFARLESFEEDSTAILIWLHG